jgi:hypothetical protein
VRRVHVCRDLSWISTANRWSKLAFIVMVARERTELATQKTTRETHYYIGSDPNASVKDIADPMCSHCAVENGCDWVLDIAFQEDKARQPAKNVGGVINRGRYASPFSCAANGGSVLGEKTLVAPDGAGTRETVIGAAQPRTLPWKTVPQFSATGL